VIIRHRTGVRTSMRIKYGDRYLGIISIRNPKESNKFLEIDVKEYQD
jgi:SPP1 family predicted phage head-tail adaptor